MKENDSWRRVSEAFDTALGLNAVEREAWLKKLFLQDSDVAKEVQSLLSSHEKSPEFLEAPVSGSLAKDILASGPLSLKENARVGDFQVLKLLGAGTFGTVYLARQLSLNREVAIKVCPNLGEEAQTMASLDHDNIVKVYSEGAHQDQGLRVICMQYIPGLTLEQVEAAVPRETVIDGSKLFGILDERCNAGVLFNPTALKEREKLALEDALGIIVYLGISLCDALEHAHKKNILHLDVKPANILITPYGRPLLADFNISLDLVKFSRGAEALVGGTLKYMSPEHRHAFENYSPETFKALDSRADVFSLGVILKSLMGRVGDSESATEMRRILDKATAPEVSERFSSAADFSKALQRFKEHKTLRENLPGEGPFLRWAEKSPLSALLLALLVPQILASAVNIAYNGTQIVGRLTTEQQEFFVRLCLVWNPFIYLPCLVILAWRLAPMLKFVRDSKTNPFSALEGRELLRRQILNYPLWVTGVTTVGWFFSSFFFPTMIDHFKGPIALSVYGHFLISFILSWLIALTYSFTFVQFLAIRVLYPLTWVGCTQDRVSIRKELEPVGRRGGFFHFLGGVIPLAGAVLLVLSSQNQMSPSEYGVFKLLIISLIASGILGIFFSLKARDLLSKTLMAFTGMKR